jgi:hypothetical protein
MFTFFKKNNHPEQRYIYAVTAGAYLGELLVYMKDEGIIDKLGMHYSFLSLPTMTIRHIPVEKFDMGIKEKIVEVVERIPKKVYDVCVAQYKKNIVQNDTLTIK